PGDPGPLGGQRLGGFGYGFRRQLIPALLLGAGAGVTGALSSHYYHWHATHQAHHHFHGAERSPSRRLHPDTPPKGQRSSINEARMRRARDPQGNPLARAVRGRLPGTPNTRFSTPPMNMPRPAPAATSKGKWAPR